MGESLIERRRVQDEGLRVVNCGKSGRKLPGTRYRVRIVEMAILKVEDLDVYKRSYRLALEVHRETLQFPHPDKFELGGQMRRASKSIPTNTAEGFAGRASTVQYVRYLNIARDSCDEIFTHLRFAHDLGYFSESKYNYFFDEYKIVAKQLTNLAKKWKSFSSKT